MLTNLGDGIKEKNPIMDLVTNPKIKSMWVIKHKVDDEAVQSVLKLETIDGRILYANQAGDLFDAGRNLIKSL